MSGSPVLTASCSTGPHIHKHTQTQKERGIQSHPSSRCSYDQFMEDLTCCIPVSIANATCRLKLCSYRGELQNSKDYWTGNFETFVIERWEGYVDIVLVCKYKANKRTLQVAEIASQLTQPQHRMNTAKKNVIKYTSSIKSHLSNSYHFLWWHQLHVSGELSRIPNGPATLLDGEVFVPSGQPPLRCSVIRQIETVIPPLEITPQNVEAIIAMSRSQQRNGKAQLKDKP